MKAGFSGRLYEWMARLWHTMRRRRTDADLEEELRLHLEMAAEDAARGGGNVEDARRDARVRAGGVAQAMESLRDQRGLPWLRDLASDLRHGQRLLRRSPVFTATAVLSLALGIGANTAIFSLIDAVMLRYLPVHEPARLVQLVRQRPPYGRGLFSYPLYSRYRTEATSFDGLLAEAWLGRRDIAFDGQTETVNLELVSSNYYSVLGVAPVAGHTFIADDDASKQPVAVLSHGYWRRRFAGDPSVVGKTFRVNDTIFTIAGVTPPEFFGTIAGRTADVTLPLSMDAAARGGPSWLARWQFGWLRVMGRVRSGRSIPQAQAEVSTIFSRVNEDEAARADRDAARKEILGQTMTLQPAGAGFDELRREFSEPLRVLMGVVGLVLLIACANLANLLLARAAARQSELSLRRALGASRSRIVRQLLAEGLLLAALGGALGVALAWWLAGGLISIMSNGGPRIAIAISPDSRMLSFAALASVVACLLFSAAPAWQSSRVNPQAGARVSGRWRFGRGLIAVQIGIAILLTIGAGLFGRTLLNLYSFDAGFTRSGVLMATVNVRKAGYAGDRARAVQDRIVEALGTLPGAASASLTLIVPISGGGWDGDVHVEGHAEASGEDLRTHLNAVGPRYFATLGTPVLAGREFSDRDAATSPPVAIVNETFARRYFGAQSPLGRWILLSGADRKRTEIVGLVQDMKYESLRQAVPPTVFFAVRQSATAMDVDTYVMRTAGNSLETAASISAALARIDPNLRATELRTLTEHIDRSLLQERMLATLTGGFGILSLLLVAVGVYGVVAFQVARRTKEMGIRITLGAQPHQVIMLMLRETVTPVALGLLFGVAAAIPTTRLAEAMLFGVTPEDPATFVGACTALTLLALAAAWVPGRRAARLNPATTLRSE